MAKPLTNKSGSKFPIDKVGRLQKLTFLKPDGTPVDVNWPQIKITYLHGQIALYYNGPEGEFYMPLCRLSGFLNHLIHRSEVNNG